MLAIAEELSPGLEFVQASADAIPFDDGDFDALTCQQGLQFFPDRRAGLAEMRRIVRPGGQVVVATWCDPSQSGFAVIARVLTRHLGESVGNIMLAPFVINQEADLRGLLEEAGLSQIVVERETIEARYADPDEYAIKVMMAGPMAGPLMEQSEATRAALAADITAELGPMRQGNELVFPMPTLIATARASDRLGEMLHAGRLGEERPGQRAPLGEERRLAKLHGVRLDRLPADAQQKHRRPLGRAMQLDRDEAGRLGEHLRHAGREHLLELGLAARGDAEECVLVDHVAESARSWAARRPATTAGTLVLPRGTTGITEQSATRTFARPWTRSSGSTTGPMLQLPTGW